MNPKMIRKVFLYSVLAWLIVMFITVWLVSYDNEIINNICVWTFRIVFVFSCIMFILFIGTIKPIEPKEKTLKEKSNIDRSNIDKSNKSNVTSNCLSKSENKILDTDKKNSDNTDTVNKKYLFKTSTDRIYDEAVKYYGKHYTKNRSKAEVVEEYLNEEKS